MPGCFVPGCKLGYRMIRSLVIDVFSRHLRIEMNFRNGLELFLGKIGRDESRVCDLHFSEQLIIKTDSFIVRGEKVEILSDNWKLKSGAIPHLFVNFPQYLSVPIKSRKRPAVRDEVPTQSNKRNEDTSMSRDTRGLISNTG